MDLRFAIVLLNLLILTGTYTLLQTENTYSFFSVRRRILPTRKMLHIDTLFDSVRFSSCNAKCTWKLRAIFFRIVNVLCVVAYFNSGFLSHFCIVLGSGFCPCAIIIIFHEISSVWIWNVNSAWWRKKHQALLPPSLLFHNVDFWISVSSKIPSECTARSPSPIMWLSCVRECVVWLYLFRQKAIRKTKNIQILSHGRMKWNDIDTCFNCVCAVAVTGPQYVEAHLHF